MTGSELALLSGLGIAAGVLNTLAGGGSMLLVPTMIVMGIPAVAASATLRPAILMQGLFGLFGFFRAGVLTRSFVRSALPLAAAAVPGACLGAYLLTRRIADHQLELVLALVMAVMAVITLRAPKPRPFASAPARGPVLVVLSMLGVGLYGGFIQIGVGFVLASALVIGRWSRMIEVQAAKVIIVVAYTIIALPIYIGAGAIVWEAAAALALGQSLGGYLGAKFGSRASDRGLRLFHVGAMLVFALVLAVRALRPLS